MTLRLSPIFAQYAPALVAFATAAATPMRASGVAPQQGLLGIALLATLVLMVASSDIRHQFAALWTQSATWAVAAIFACWAITIPFSHDPAGSLTMGGRTAVFVAASALIWSALRANTDTHPFLCKVLVITSVAMTALALLSLMGVPYILSALQFQEIAKEKPVMSFKAYGAATMCLIPAVVWAGRRLGKSWRWWGYGFVPMALAVIVLTGNRSALVGLMVMVAAGALLLILTWRKHTKSLLTLAVSAMVGTIAWIHTTQDWRVQAEGTYLPTWLIDTHRQYIWRFTFEKFLDHPLVGNGIDQINKVPGADALVAALGKNSHIVPSHPHNWALEVLSEAGLLGFVPVLIALGFIAWRLVKSYMAHENDADLALIVLMAGFWGSALFNFSIWASWWQLTFFVLFALVSSARRTPSSA